MILESTIMWMLQACMVFFMVFGAIGLLVKAKRDIQNEKPATHEDDLGLTPQNEAS